MTKFFPFPLQRGNLQRFSSTGEVLEGEGNECFNNLQPNSNLAHLVTVNCTKAVRIRSENTPKLPPKSDFKTTPIKLTLKYKYLIHLKFKSDSYVSSERNVEIDVTSNTEFNFNDELIERYRRPGETFCSAYDSVKLEFFDENMQKIDVSLSGVSDLQLGGFSSTYGHRTYVSLAKENQYSMSNFFDYKEVAGLDHLVAYLWYAGRGKKCLSFYWDTTKELAIAPSVNRKYYEVTYEGIFRFTPSLQRGMLSQHDIITRFEHNLQNFANGYGRELPEVDGEIEHPNPIDFNLNLRDYQAKALTWLAKQEMDPFSMEFCLVSSSDGAKKISVGDGTYKNQTFPQKIYGGILASETGSGKTLVTLALMKQYPMDRGQIPATDLEKYENGNLIVKATLVICPANLVNQWEDEYHKCISNGGRIIKITTIIQARRYTLADIQEADMILMSHAFLSNKNFYNQKNSLKVKYLALKYHRIVVDEFHELLNNMYTKIGELRASSCMFEIFAELDAYRKLGLTGTPNFHLIPNVVHAAQILGVYLPPLKLYTELFLRNYVRRSVPDLHLPPVVYEQIDVTLNPVERAIYQSLGNSNRAAVLLCNHFDTQRYEHINSDDPINLLEDERGVKLLSVDDVALKIQAGRKDAIERETKELEKQRGKLRDMMLTRSNQNNQAEISSVQQEIERGVDLIEQLKGEHAFFDNVLQTLKNRSEQECNICLNQFENEDSVALTRCGHIFCHSCIDRSLKLKPVCPICRRKIEPNTIYRVAPSEEDQEIEEPVVRAQNSNFGTSSANPIMIDFSDDDDAENINPNIVARQTDNPSEASVEQNAEAPIDQHFYGSKITKMVTYINNLFETNAEARVILFIQFSQLSRLVSGALNSLGIRNSFVSGNIHVRNNAIEKFKQGEVKVIILSAETSVTGLHLTEATHVVLLHPFYSNEGRDRAVAAEKQGVARAYRLGLTHELKVVRFVVKDTIEEEMMRDRPALPI